MAALQNQKRQHAKDHVSQSNLPRKKIRSNVERSNYPPRFWDCISKIPLTSRALRELDRRRNTQPTPNLDTLGEVYSRGLAQYARHGGPDLRHLRGFPEPNVATSAMLPTSSSHSYELVSIEKSKKSSTSSRGPEFEQHLIDHGIYPNNRRSKAQNLQDIREALLRSRSSLSPSRFSDRAFEDFLEKNEDVIFDEDVMNVIIPIICGNTNIPHTKSVTFTELQPITNSDVTRPKPDFFDGSYLADIDETIRNNKHMYPLTIPTKCPDVPVVPNFFLEAKREDGSLAVAKRKACYYGAYGARAMHSLQNYGNDELVYDNGAYTFSSTYHGGSGLLQLYAHHSTAPSTPGGRPEYHMARLNAYALTGSRETFMDGATAFRNTRDLAKLHRDRFIHAANALVRQADLLIGQDEINHTIETQHDSSGTRI
ncbi:hypothetical protein F4808DRAFT_459517 [Astrocystis sublimbata]|nr:hypothetical protein F4808DRAFT_459517 [Astrocystis sublimbata]